MHAVYSYHLIERKSAVGSMAEKLYALAGKNLRLFHLVLSLFPLGDRDVQIVSLA